MTVKDASLSLVTKEIFKLNIERTPQLVESSGVFAFIGVSPPRAPHGAWRGAHL